MSESAQARGEAEGRPAPAPDFRSTLSGEADGTVSGGAAGSAAHVEAAPSSGAAEGAAEAVPGPRITGALHEPAAPQAPEVALDRPGKPVLAGAAIAGLLLVAAPFAMTAGVPGVTLDTTPLASGAGGADGTGGQSSGTAESGASAGGESGGGAGQADTGAAAVPQETGYVPEVGGDGVSTPTMPDPGTAATGGGNPVETAPAAQDVPDTAAAGAPETGGGAGEATAAGEPGSGGAATAAGEPGTGSAATEGGDTATGPSAGEEGAAGADTAAGGDEGAGTSGEGETDGAAGEGSGNGDTGTGDSGTGTAAEEMNAPLADTTGTGGTARESGAAGNGDAAGGGAAADPPTSEGGGSVLADSGAVTAASEPESFLAVAGPGCQASPGASYANEGRWDSAEGTASWATRPGGYAQEGCDGGYEALPVSGDPERGNGQYATWTFTPGEAGVACELYVHVPDDESPLWISPGEAKYQLFSGPAAEGSPVAVFGIDQAGIRGGWVQVTGFTSPTEEFTVQLTNAGTDALADQEHASSHVAASAVRASCS
ncbi:hypothetical protein [Nocardiopsis alborubida]|uniref:Uncharacterized protein n=1 Tax=Nocardiopsis alborubida TaxID=146802 RepID=A0A7X6RSR9_9ACTN|nr:hypothetical protein [Nocardiopsis alborubida]NKZ00959.1 hypothetical protein [Nocardiopsis alborubida]